MKEKFHKTQRIAKERYLQITKKDNHPASIRFIIMYLIFIILNIAVVRTWGASLIYVIPLQSLYGIVCCSVFASIHETVHGTAFKSKSLNKIASLLAGFGHIYPPSLFRDLHFTHHRFTHIPGKDPEISMGNKPLPSILSNPGSYMGWITGLPLLLFKILMLIGGVIYMPKFARNLLFPFVSPKNKKNIFIECFIYTLLYVSIIYYGFMYDPRFIAILTGQITGHLILATYLTMEHNGLPHEGNILEKTRSINTMKFVKLVMWNMPYHAEHHAYPAVPFHKLPDLHTELIDELPHKTDGPYSFHKSQILNFIKGATHS